MYIELDKPCWQQLEKYIPFVFYCDVVQLLYAHLILTILKTFMSENKNAFQNISAWGEKRDKSDVFHLIALLKKNHTSHEKSHFSCKNHKAIWKYLMK